MTELEAVTLRIDKADKERLLEESRKLGFQTISGLVRFLIKQYLIRLDKGGDALTSA